MQKKYNKNFDDNNKSQLIKIFCGAGKTMIICDCIFKYGGELSVIVVPSINLITQFNRDYLFNDTIMDYNKRNYNKQFELLTICSKNELNKETTDIICTTDEETILEF